LNLFSPPFLWPSSFPYSFHSGSNYFFGIHSLIVLSLCPYHLHQSDFVNFTIPAPCGVSGVPLFFFTSFLLLLWDHIFFLQSTFQMLCEHSFHLSSLSGFCTIA
jgi:hypothetical protein